MVRWRLQSFYFNFQAASTLNFLFHFNTPLPDLTMSTSSVTSTATNKTGLISPHPMKPALINCPSTPPQVTEPPLSTPLPSSQPSTPKPQIPRKPCMPATPRAPRKRSSTASYLPASPAIPPKRLRNIPSTPDSTPTKSRCARKRNILALDYAPCIPLHVLRAQTDDTSALLRPLPRSSDHLAKLVKISIERGLEKVRAPGCTGILDAVVLSPRRKITSKHI